MPWQPTCWVSHEHKPKKKLKSKVIILVFLHHIRNGKYSFNSILSYVWKEENTKIKNITINKSLTNRSMTQFEWQPYNTPMP